MPDGDDNVPSFTNLNSSWCSWGYMFPVISTPCLSLSIAANASTPNTASGSRRIWYHITIPFNMYHEQMVIHKLAFSRRSGIVMVCFLFPCTSFSSSFTSANFCGTGITDVAANRMALLEGAHHHGRVTLVELVWHVIDVLVMQQVLGN